MENLISKDFVPLYQTLIWIIFAGLLIVVFWGKLNQVLHGLVRRIEAGATLKIGILDIGAPPSSLKNDKIGAATTEGKSGEAAPQDVETLLRTKAYPQCILETHYLVHAAEIVVPRTTPRSGRYRVRAWVEASPPSLIDEIKSVTYRLYDNFPNQVITTTACEKNFELWLTAYGEFTLVAYIQRKNNRAPIWLSRYLDLPGRPPD
jgi:hypothetical protein